MTEKIYYFDTVKGFSEFIKNNYEEFKRDGCILFMDFRYDVEYFQPSPTQNIPRVMVEVRVSADIKGNLCILNYRSFNSEVNDVVPLILQILKEVSTELKERLGSDIKILSGGIYTPIDDRNNKIMNIYNLIEIERLRKDFYGSNALKDQLSSIYSDIEPVNNSDDLDEDLSEAENKLKEIFDT